MLLPRPALHGIYVLCFLSRVERGVVVPAREVAEAMRLPPEQTAKVLRALAAAGIIRAHRGREGGYSLARGLTEINLAQVYEAVHEPEEIGGGGSHFCVVAAKEVCSARRGLDRLREEFWGLLQRKTMAALAGRPCSKRLLPTARLLRGVAANRRQAAVR